MADSGTHSQAENKDSTPSIFGNVVLILKKFRSLLGSQRHVISVPLPEAEGGGEDLFEKQPEQYVNNPNGDVGGIDVFDAGKVVGHKDGVVIGGDPDPKFLNQEEDNFDCGAECMASITGCCSVNFGGGLKRGKVTKIVHA